MTRALIFFYSEAQSGFSILRDELDRVAERLDRFSRIIRNFDPEFLFERHHKLNSIQTVSTKIVDEACLLYDFVFFNAEMLYDDLFHTICNIAHEFFLNLEATASTLMFIFGQ